MIEMRFHGRGGQGAVTSAELVASRGNCYGKICHRVSELWAGKKGRSRRCVCKG